MNLPPAAFAGALLLFAGCAYSQPRQAPTDTDLQASYCARFFAIRASNIESADELKGSRAAKESVAGDRELVARIQGYLLPRISYLEPLGLLTAAKQADVDYARAQREQAACVSHCGPPGPIGARIACLENCNGFAMFRRCDGARFLPY